MPRRKSRISKTEPWFVYILRCEGGSFYTGVAKDIDRRLEMHRRGRGAAYTRVHKPIEVVYREKMRGRVPALLREIEIKRMPRQKKEKLVLSGPPRRRAAAIPKNPWKTIFKR